MPTDLEWKLYQALERIEAILNDRPTALINEDAETTQMRSIIDDAFKAVAAERARAILAV